MPPSIAIATPVLGGPGTMRVVLNSSSRACVRKDAADKGGRLAWCEIIRREPHSLTINCRSVVTNTPAWSPLATSAPARCRTLS